MHKVAANSLAEYFAADPGRRRDLVELDKIIRRQAPRLRSWFYPGAKPGENGMRFKLIGYGCTEYRGMAGTRWPVIGVALQKNYISIYVAVESGSSAPITEKYRGKLGEDRMGRNNFSFVSFFQLRPEVLGALLTEIDQCAIA